MSDSITFTIKGVPRVKKNGQKVVFSHGSKFKINTKSYIEWHDEAIRHFSNLGYNPQFDKINKLRKKMKQDLKIAQFNCPVNLQCVFYMDKMIRVDLSALYEGIQDVLVEVGVLQDDNAWIVRSHDGSRVLIDTDNPRMEITISKLT